MLDEEHLTDSILILERARLNILQDLVAIVGIEEVDIARVIRVDEQVILVVEEDITNLDKFRRNFVEILKRL